VAARILSNNIDTERFCQVGAIPLSPVRTDINLQSEYYYPSGPGKMRQAILNLQGQYGPIDLVTVCSEPPEMKLLKEVGGATYFASINDSIEFAP